jgi:raffinose/stachyose/melibiose transport system substrate-binding protein
VNWWGWTPTDTATANGYIAAFNKEYPDIKVNFKLVSIPDWQAALTPALRSDSGPDVFDMQPGSYVDKYKSFTEDLTPVIEKALGPDWQSKVAPAGVSGLTADGKLTAMSVGAVYSGTLWINQGLFQQHNLKPPTTLDEWDQVCQEFKKQNQGCFVQGAAGSGFNQDTMQSIANSVEPGYWIGTMGNGFAPDTPAALSAAVTAFSVAYWVYQVPIMTIAYLPVRKSLLASGYCW